MLSSLSFKGNREFSSSKWTGLPISRGHKPASTCNKITRATVLKHRLIKLLLLYFTCQYLASPWPCTHKAINTLLLKVGVLKQNKYCQPENGAFYNAKLRNVPSFFHNHSLSITFLEERNLLLLMTSYMQGSDTVSLKRRLRVRLLAIF